MRPPTNALAQRWPAFPNSTEASDMKKTLALAAMLAVSLGVANAQERGPAKPLPKPDAEGQKPRAAVVLAPYRFNDILWENDRTAHRIYGPALEAAEPPSTSGIDAWGKSERWPFMDRQLRTGDQHPSTAKVWTSTTSTPSAARAAWASGRTTSCGPRATGSPKILKTGPDVASFKVDYAPWPVDVDRKVWETRTFTLPLGTNFTRMVSTISSDKPGPLVVGIGITKRKRHPPSGSGVFKKDLAPGRVSFWEPTDPVKGTMGIALMVDPKSLVEVRQDADNYLVLVKVEPGKPFVYYMGAAWDKGLDFHTAAEWDAYVTGAKADFDPTH
jgi:hypothetical protein